MTLRSGRTFALSALLLAVACTPARIEAPEPPPPDARAEVDQLLDLAGIESIVSGRAGSFTRQVAFLAGDLTDAELETLVPVVNAAFAPDRLRDDVSQFLLSEDSGGRLATVLEGYENGASGELLRLARAHEPSQTLSEFTNGLMTERPDPSRLGSVVALAEAKVRATSSCSWTRPSRKRLTWCGTSSAPTRQPSRR